MKSLIFNIIKMKNNLTIVLFILFPLTLLVYSSNIINGNPSTLTPIKHDDIALKQKWPSDPKTWTKCELCEVVAGKLQGVGNSTLCAPTGGSPACSACTGMTGDPKTLLGCAAGAVCSYIATQICDELLKRAEAAMGLTPHNANRILIVKLWRE